MWTYLWLDLAVLTSALLGFIFLARSSFFKSLKQALISITTVAIPFLIWDYYATARGDWAFSTLYTSGFKILNLPIEEILFFVVAPFGCVVIYLAVERKFTHRLGNWTIGQVRPILMATGLLASLLGYIYFHLPYTKMVSLISAVIALNLAWKLPPVLLDRKLWLAILICFVPFFIMNSVLTGLPIISYNSAAITNWRITTIPIEDFSYNLILVGATLTIFAHLNQKPIKLS